MGLRRFRRILLWVFVPVLAIVGTALISFWATKRANADKQIVPYNKRYDAIGQAGVKIDPDDPKVFSVTANPTVTAEEALEVPALSLMVQHNPTWVQETAKEPSLPAGTRDQIRRLVNDTVLAWESMSPGQDATYAERLEPFLHPDYATRIIGRQDDRMPEGVGVCAECETGTMPRGSVSPGDLMQVRTIDQGGIIVTTQADVAYTDGGLLAGEVYRRAYTLVLRKDDANSWKVARIVAESLPRN